MPSKLLYKGLMGSVITPAIWLGVGIAPAVGQEAFVPVINDVAPPAQAPAGEVFTPLREGSVTSTPLTPPLPESLTAPAPSFSAPQSTAFPAPSVQSSPPINSYTNSYTAPITSLPSIADLVDEVSPSVVNIVVTTDDGETTSEGQGSGFIISSNKEVVTNYHVIDGGTNIEIEFNDGQKFPASIIGTDEETDLALLKIESPKDFPHVDFHQGTKTRIGDWVVAIGNPFGIGQSTSLGVISAIGRSRVDSGSYVDYIQTDATINRGNSGGPLFNLKGDVVGVNSAIYSPTGASVGIAFVIPHQTAEGIISSIRQDGKVRRGYLGAGLRTATFELDDNKGVFKSGATITSVVPGSPAEIYGLQFDDIILRINDQTVRNSVEATRAIGGLRPGDVAKIIYEREEKTYSQNVSIGERPEKIEIQRASAIAQGLPPPPPKEPARAKVNIDTGLQVLDLSAEFRSAIGMRPDQVGIYVESVTPGSGAEASGFKTGMVLLDADAQPLAEVASLRSIVLNAKIAEQESIVMNVRLKDGQETYMVLAL